MQTHSTQKGHLTCRGSNQGSSCSALAGLKVEDEVEYMDTSDTPWYWFYKTESGVWHRVDDEAVIFMSSAELERYYARNQYGVVNITTAGGPFQINFAKKIQVNLTTGQTRQIKRSCLTKNSFSYRCKYDAVSTSPPAHWENADPEKPYQAFTVTRGSSEYQEIESFVKDVGLLQQPIVSINRIQNTDLWELFCRKKIQLKRIKGQSEIEEQKLFHGTSFNNLDSICTFNFNCRLPQSKRRIGHAYGKGTYFAKYASYANTYSEKITDRDTKIMLLARVIVGKYKKGSVDYCTPDDEEDKYTYDSCVDNIHYPTVFVIFDSNQIYPEYVLEYRSALADLKLEDKMENKDPSDIQWYWFYKEHGAWHMVEDEPVIFMSSGDLERYYIKNPYGVVNMTTAGGPVMIDFAKKIQVNLRTGQTRQIERSFMIKNSVRCKCDAVSTSPPAHWEYADPKEPYQAFTVKRESSEYQKIESFVKDVGLLQQTIVSICRIQNVDLWELYCRKKIQLMKIKGQSEIEEQKLFHGTSVNNLHSICTFNFNCRLPQSKRRRHTYGNGTYFAKHASYADNYSEINTQGTKIMLLARVIVGKYKTGSRDYCTPDDDENEYTYDSCVDDTRYPRIFVIFDSNQIYPEYVLEYR
ncbi:uncharacterized protein [Paramisgurnus dabryanus]|uniref:uncharacterized protein n=1 Tax=Paramisgurnus dabryanus TaxID=90735 RepID=UPI003CCF03A1